jgi:hypothetical protein
VGAVTLSGVGWTTIVLLMDADRDGALLSTTVAVNVDEPLTAAVPVIAPVAESRIPPGSEPDVTIQV